MAKRFSMQIRTRVGVTLGLLSCIVLAMGGFAMYAISQSNRVIQEIHNGDMAGAADIAVIQLGVSRQRLALDRAVLVVGTPEASDRVKTLASRQKQMDDAWRHFQSLPSNAQASQLANAFGAATADLRKAVGALAQSILANDKDDLIDQMRDLTKQYEIMSTRADALNKYLNDQATRRYDAAIDMDGLFRTVAVGAIVVALLLTFFSYVTLRGAIIRPISTVLEQLRHIASGDLSRRIPAHANDELGRVIQGLGEMQARLRTTIGQVRSSGESITAATREIAAGNLDLSSRTEEQAASLSQTTSSMNEITGMVRQNADNASQASTLAAGALSTAGQGRQVMGRMTDTMGTIGQSSREIGEIVALIEAISFQTNILALNAAVEAARAGEQGKGFAVVAGEVRALAQRSATAAKEIKALIGTSTDRVQQGMDLVSEASDTMQEIIASVQRVADLMGEIAAASTEQRRGIEQVALAVTQMDEMTQSNAALVEQSAAAAQSLDEQAQHLARSISAFKTSEHDAPAAEQPVALLGMAAT